MFVEGTCFLLLFLFITHMEYFYISKCSTNIERVPTMFCICISNENRHDPSSHKVFSLLYLNGHEVYGHVHTKCRELECQSFNLKETLTTYR